MHNSANIMLIYGIVYWDEVWEKKVQNDFFAVGNEMLVKRLKTNIKVK